jgi:hypothetical protein
VKSLNKVDKHTLNIDKTTFINFVASSKPVTGMNTAYCNKSVQEADTQKSLLVSESTDFHRQTNWII